MKSFLRISVLLTLVLALSIPLYVSPAQASTPPAGLGPPNGVVTQSFTIAPGGRRIYGVADNNDDTEPVAITSCDATLDGDPKARNTFAIIRIGFLNRRTVPIKYLDGAFELQPTAICKDETMSSAAHVFLACPI